MKNHYGSFFFLEITDCKFIKDNGILSATGDNVYVINLHGSIFNVVCDMFTDGGGWTVSHFFTCIHQFCHGTHIAVTYTNTISL